MKPVAANATQEVIPSAGARFGYGWSRLRAQDEAAYRRLDRLIAAGWDDVPQEDLPSDVLRAAESGAPIRKNPSVAARRAFVASAKTHGRSGGTAPKRKR